MSNFELNRIYNEDCIEGMRRLPDGSVDLVVTSPPYDGIRDYNNNWSIDLPKIGKEISRVLKDGGMAVMVIQDQTKDGRKSLTSFKTIVDWCENTELDLWECCIYSRHGRPGAWWSKRFRVDHEYIPIFIKGKRPQYFNKEHMKVLPKRGGIQKSGGVRKTDGNITDGFMSTGKPKCLGTVLGYASSSQEKSDDWYIKKEHPATFPEKLASDFIQCFTTEGMTVLDPMIGSGTVAVQTILSNRNFIGFEIEPEYVEIAEKRVSERRAS